MALSAVIGWSVGGAVAVLVSALARPAVVISISVRTVSSGLTWSAAESAVMGDNNGHSMETNTNNHQQDHQQVTLPPLLQSAGGTIELVRHEAGLVLGEASGRRSE